MEQPWFKNYPEGIPREIDGSKYKNVVDILENTFEKYTDNNGYHNMGTTLTYGQMDRLSKKFASFLQNELGHKKGDRVAIMLPNILQYPVVVMGILRAGLVAVNVNPLYTARELEHQLKDSGSKTIIIFANSANVLEKVLDNTPIKDVIVTEIGDMLKFPKNLLVNFVIKNVKKMIPKWNISFARTWKEAMTLGDESQFKPVEISMEDTAFLQYTGGTTGVSKGAELTHKNITSNVQQAMAWLAPFTEEKKEIVITPLPLYHIFSLTANLFTFTAIGGMAVFITNPRDMPGFINELKKWRFTALTGVNTLFNGLLSQEEFKNVDFSSLKLTLGGGMAVQKSVADKWQAVTGTALVEAYGLTETSPAACMNPLNIPGYNGTIGLPISSTEVVIKNDEGDNLAPGVNGEICIKGPQVMKGYWNRPDETEKVMTSDGYFRTGDIAFMDEEGFFKIVDRKKDMILVSGFNVYPNEIEDVVSHHPKVFEVAAIGVPDEKSGELVKIFVVKKDDSLTESELKSFCKENLTGYKMPRQIEFRLDLPKSNVGKILRKELRG